MLVIESVLMTENRFSLNNATFEGDDSKKILSAGLIPWFTDEPVTMTNKIGCCKNKMKKKKFFFPYLLL